MSGAFDLYASIISLSQGEARDLITTTLVQAEKRARSQALKEAEACVIEFGIGNTVLSDYAKIQKSGWDMCHATTLAAIRSLQSPDNQSND